MTESAANDSGSAPTDTTSEPKGRASNMDDILKNPIPGPKHVGPNWMMEPDLEVPLSPLHAMGRFMADLVRKPAHYIRENIVLPNKGPKYYWYHRKFPRALPIDECYIDDFACQYEANLEYKRTHMVDRYVLDQLRYRRDACWVWYQGQHASSLFPKECEELSDTYNREEENFHIKYGDLHAEHGVVHAFNRQKNRMIVDRRRALKKQKEEEEAARYGSAI